MRRRALIAVFLAGLIASFGQLPLLLSGAIPHANTWLLFGGLIVAWAASMLLWGRMPELPHLSEREMIETRLERLLRNGHRPPMRLPPTPTPERRER